MKNWKEYKLSEICDTQYGYTASATDLDTGVKFLRITDIASSLFIDWVNVPFCEIEEKDQAKYSLKHHDIVVARTGATVGFAKQIKENSPKSVFASYLVRLTVKKGFDRRFIGFIVESNFYKDFINTIASGSAQPNANAQDLVAIKLKLPPLSMQHQIAAILGKYDDLIVNYEQQIHLLEQTAKELYREWFVRGRCPLGSEGWETKRLGDIAFDKREIVKPKDFEENTPYVGLEHLSVKSIVIRDFGTVEDVDSDKLKFVKGDILFSKIRPYLHKVCLSHFEGACSSDAIVIKPIQNDDLGFILFTVFSDTFIDFADNVSNGTKMPRSEWSVLKTYDIEMPPPDISKAFNKIVLPIFEQIENLQRQSATLRTTRDKLLPRLLRGDLLASA